MDYLFAITQAQYEPLRSYVQKFMKIQVKIFECYDSLAVAAFQKRPHVYRDFYSFLTRRMPRYMVEDLQHDKGYIALERIEETTRSKHKLLYDEKSRSAKVEKLKTVKRISEFTCFHQLGDLSKQATKNIVFPGPIPHLNLTIGLGEVVRFLKGKDYVTWLKPMRALRRDLRR